MASSQDSYQMESGSIPPPSPGEYCQELGIEAKVHYPVPIYRQPALSHLGYKAGDYPVTDAHTHRIITFPCDQHLSRKEMDFVIQTVTDFYRKTS